MSKSPNRCKTCRDWKSTKDGEGECHGFGDECVMVDGPMVTIAEFGCIFWEPRDAGKDEG